MAENENKKSGSKQAADAAKTAVNVAKGAGRMAGNDCNDDICCTKRFIYTV